MKPLPLLAALVALAGCAGSGDSRGDSATLNRRPLAYQPEAFTDLPLELLRGYRLAADQEPLAVAYGGGALRRFDVVYLSATEEAEKPRQLLDRLAGGLADRGWVRLPAEAKAPADAPDRYRKGDEVLSVAAETTHDRLQVTWHLLRAPLPAATATDAAAKAP